MAEANTLAAENLLAQMLTGIPHHGDTYRVRIEWLRERSP